MWDNIHHFEYIITDSELEVAVALAFKFLFDLGYRLAGDRAVNINKVVDAVLTLCAANASIRIGNGALEFADDCIAVIKKRNEAVGVRIGFWNTGTQRPMYRTRISNIRSATGGVGARGKLNCI